VPRRKVTPTADPTPAIRRIAHGPSQNEVEGRMKRKIPVTEAITPRVARSHCRLSIETAGLRT
jgi:hypothetical protein